MVLHYLLSSLFSLPVPPTLEEYFLPVLGEPPAKRERTTNSVKSWNGKGLIGVCFQFGIQSDFVSCVRFLCNIAICMQEGNVALKLICSRSDRRAFIFYFDEAFKKIKYHRSSLEWSLLLCLHRLAPLYFEGTWL